MTENAPTDANQPQPGEHQSPTNPVAPEADKEHEIPASKLEHNRTDTPEHWPNRVVALSTCVLVIITGVYACYARQQATAAIDSATAAKDAADAAKTSAATTDQQVHRGERAYLGLSKIRLKTLPATGKDLRLTFGIENTGRTPAQNVVSASNLEIFIGEPPAAQLLPPDGTPSDIGAGKTDTGGAIRVLPLRPDDVKDISKEFFSLRGNVFSIERREAGRRLFFYGLIKYTDVFGGHDETEFCYVYMPKSMHGADGATFAQCTFPNRNRIR
jgi:hypothetical protein